MTSFDSVPEQVEAKRLLVAAIADGNAHAYLLHGPPGVGKTSAAFAFAASLLGDERRVLARTHPDLVVIEALGEMIRIDEIRELHHDLHLRPYENARRVYLLLDAHRLNDDAADALLKDLEEPPAYATLVLVADELGPIPETVRSRCQLVPFRRLSEQAVSDWVGVHAPGLSMPERTALARVAAGRLDRARRLLDPAAQERRQALIGVARGVYREPSFDAGEAARTLLAASAVRAGEARELEEAQLEGIDLPAREAEQRVRRAGRGAEREELLAQLEELAAWYRDLIVVSTGATAAVVHADRLDDMHADHALGLGRGPERAAELAREAWRNAEEFNVNAGLWLEALFVRLRRAFA